MNPLLEQFLSEAREFLQGIGEKLMQLEDEPDNAELMTELFRFVHTLKGNSGLFEFPEMTRVLHAGEDLMDAVRKGRVAYSQALADQLLDAMDFVGILCDEIDAEGHIDASRAADSARLAKDLRALIIVEADGTKTAEDHKPTHDAAPQSAAAILAALPLSSLPELNRIEAFRRANNGDIVHWISYKPIEECFFQGDDPFFTARQTPDILWGNILAREPWPPLAELDAYKCILEFQILSAAPRKELDEHYQYMPDQVEISKVDPLFFVIPQGNPNGGPVYGDFIDDVLPHLETGNIAALKTAAETMLELSNPDLWLSSALRWLILLIDSIPENKAAMHLLIESLRTLTPPDWSAATSLPTDTSPDEKVIPASTSAPAEKTLLSDEDAAAIKVIFAAQYQILSFDDKPSWLPGRLQAVAAVLVNCCKVSGDLNALDEIEEALEQSLRAASSTPLLTWLEIREGQQLVTNVESNSTTRITAATPTTAPIAKPVTAVEAASEQPVVATSADEGPRFGRRSEDAGTATSTKSLKVDQTKIDRLMNLIGEMVVSKNALPYLAQRAEDQFGVRELSREIKSQYSVINRIAEEMQDAIMQVRMMPVSFVFQRFPRLVRDISRKLGKEVQLVLEGEETEADKNIIESLADPLIHIVRNSLDHGLETPDARLAKGKPATGTLTIRAVQEGDQVVIEIIDDGKGIDPNIIKRKAYEKGVIDEATMERITDREAINLVFAAGFSTAEVVSDLSGRGVGMDVVRTAVEKVNGTIQLESETGKGTRIRISLPLSMAVTKVMIVESDRQIFGVPMDHVMETVRVPNSAIRTIKRTKTTVLRGKIVPLKTLNTLLGLSAQPKANADDEMAVLVVKINGDAVGLIVDQFRETIDIIQKPLGGVLSGLSAYSGSALMGDGSVLMVLNVKEIV
jgi:two-component system chemotaxis sensor kinase CheA